MISYISTLMGANFLMRCMVMREKITHEAKQKIKTRNEEKAKVVRKEKKYKNFKKQLGNYRKVDEEEC